MTPLVSLSVRVPAETAVALKTIAAREHRTVAAQLRHMIRQHVELDRLERAA
jgi:predicted DNA-binding protein